MISIIIPVLNEAETIKRLITYLITNASEKKNIEIIVVDGGSTDGTRQLVQAIDAGDNGMLKLISSEKGRAKQMNKGAKASSGSVLYFLHADSFPPQNYDAFILSEIKKGNPAGCFRMQFDSNHWWLRLAGWLTKFNWRACRGGDQSQFITRQLFNEIGVYADTYNI